MEVPHLSWGEPDFDARSEEFLKARAKVRMAEHAIDVFETDVLLERARKYGVDEPTEPSCWADDSETVPSPEEVTFGSRARAKGNSAQVSVSSGARTGSFGSTSSPHLPA